MKNLNEKILEEKVKKLNTPLQCDKENFYSDLYAVLSDLMFNYNQTNAEPSKSEFEKQIKKFIEQFF